jgi:uracil-DNA glycosylase family 4
MIRRNIFGEEITPSPRRAAPRTQTWANPCAGCPRDKAKAVKVPPHFPKHARLVAVGMAPGKTEEIQRTPFVGESGDLLRQALRAGGLDDVQDVAYINLGRCRPEDDNFESKDWAEAEQRCVTYLEQDLSQWRGPLLLLGSRPAQYFFRDAKARVTSKRGLWYTLPDGRSAFVENHPSAVLRAGGKSEKAPKRHQFFAGIARMAQRVLGQEQIPEARVTVYDSPSAAAAYLRKLAAGTRAGRWFFDIETYDAKEVPSRRHVATNPFDPDFRVRGVAIATGPHIGAWIELMPWQNRIADAAALLSPAFASPDEKGAFVGGFDENGLIVPGWVREVSNRTRDPWLCSIALDMVGGGHSLERLAVDVLGEPQPKAGVDRGRIREMPLAAVAEYAIRDACTEWRLDDVLQARLDAEHYLE